MTDDNDRKLDRETEVQLQIEHLQNELRGIQEGKREMKSSDDFSSEEKVDAFNKIHFICTDLATHVFVNKEHAPDHEMEVTQAVLKLCLGDDILEKMENVIGEIDTEV